MWRCGLPGRCVMRAESLPRHDVLESLFCPTRAPWFERARPILSMLGPCFVRSFCQVWDRSKPKIGYISTTASQEDRQWFGNGQGSQTGSGLQWAGS